MPKLISTRVDFAGFRTFFDVLLFQEADALVQVGNGGESKPPLYMLS